MLASLVIPGRLHIHASAQGVRDDGTQGRGERRTEWSWDERRQRVAGEEVRTVSRVGGDWSDEVIVVMFDGVARGFGA